jgi:hypothetical protein
MRTGARFWIIAVFLCTTIPVASAIAQGVDHTRGVDILNPAPQPIDKNDAHFGLSEETTDPNFNFENSAGLVVDILPDVEIREGTKVTFRVNARKAGYLIVVDVDATGVLKQIYPDPNALLAHSAKNQLSNHIAPGETLTVPKNGSDGSSSFVADPAGVAMVVAILSGRPVQVMDLPDVPTAIIGRAEALKFISTSAHSLRIARSDAPGIFEKPKLSFAAKFYIVKRP